MGMTINLLLFRPFEGELLPKYMVEILKDRMG